MAEVNQEEPYLYLAYGSNMLTRRLTAEERAPSAVLVSVGYLVGRRLAFHKVSVDRSGKCDAEATRHDSDRVYGVLFSVAAEERQALDSAEGVSKGYQAKTVDVVTPSGTVSALTYEATNKNPALKPYHWYKALVLAGAVEHSLPGPYVEWLRTIESIEDTNEERRRKNEAVLFASQQLAAEQTLP